LIIGAGEAGRMIVQEIAGHGELEARVVGYLDDDHELRDGDVEGVPVLGGTAELGDVVEAHEIDEIIIAVPTAPGRFVREMVRRCRRTGLPFKIVPGIMEIIKGDVHIEQVRDVQIEDLLGRETVDLDLGAIGERFTDSVVLVTGAGGSIGSEICRQLARLVPQRLVLLGRGENRIFDIEEELRSDHPALDIVTVIADLRDPDRISRIIRRYEPDMIYHTAAHKHVHYMERDPVEAVLNNIYGSINLIRASMGSGVERFVFLSTDKAANPIGVMGATKRIIELYLRELGMRDGTRFITVRFGNVIGSKGSVIPLFLKQITRGGPVTVSDPDATRYFMTVREASLLVIRASFMGEGGETMILDMGEAVNILEMARDIIILSGHDPETEIPIMITGLREGEKIEEELTSADERLTPMTEEKILLAEPSRPLPPDLEEKIEEIVACAKRGEESGVLAIMSDLLPGFGGPENAPPGDRGRR
jgi:FlaA1/EpsC-like NDP-sugar epimerase